MNDENFHRFKKMNILNFQVAILAEKYATDYKWYGYVDNHL